MQSRLDSPNFTTTPSPDQYLMDRAREVAIQVRKEEQEYVKFLFYHVTVWCLFWRFIVGVCGSLSCPVATTPSAWLYKRLTYMRLFESHLDFLFMYLFYSSFELASKLSSFSFISLYLNLLIIDAYDIPLANFQH